jgi:hypothetical protein
VGVNRLTTVLGNVFNPSAGLDADIADAFGDPESTVTGGGSVPIPHWLNYELVFDNATALGSATLTWTAESVDSYEVAVNGGTPESIATNSIALDNLQETTTYNWKVRAVKDSKTSEWSYTKTFQTPAVPFIDKMPGSWGATDAEVKFWLGEGNEMGLDELLQRSHTTGPVSVAMVKGSLLISSVSGMDDHIEGGVASTTSFDIDGQLANLSLNIDENAKTVSATKSISASNVYTKNMSTKIGDIPNIRTIVTPDMLGALSSAYESLMGSNITQIAITVTGVEITGTLNDNNELTFRFKYSVSARLTTDFMSGGADGLLNGKLPTPQYLVSTVAMTK